MRTSTRRSFLATSVAAASLPCMSSVLSADDSTQSKPHRPSSKFKFSLAAYSYRKLLSGDDPQLSLFDFVDDCARFGLEGTELTSYYFPEDFDSTYIARLRGHCFRQGLDVSGTAIGNDFGFPEGDRRDSEISNTKRWIEHASRLSAPVIRIFAGHQKPGVDDAKTHKLMVSAIEECCDYAGKYGVHLALENHGGPTATAEGIMAFVSDVQSPWFGVNLDTGNFHTDDIYGDLAKIAKYAINVQVKVVIKDSSGSVEPTDFERLAALLTDTAYRGYVVLEYEEKGDPRAESERYLNDLRTAMRA